MVESKLPHRASDNVVTTSDSLSCSFFTTLYLLSPSSVTKCIHPAHRQCPDRCTAQTFRKLQSLDIRNPPAVADRCHDEQGVDLSPEPRKWIAVWTCITLMHTLPGVVTLQKTCETLLQLASSSLPSTIKASRFLVSASMLPLPLQPPVWNPLGCAAVSFACTFSWIGRTSA